MNNLNFTLRHLRKRPGFALAVMLTLVVGLVAAFWLTRLLRKQLYEVSPNDPVLMAAVVLLLLVVALLACYLPARRAARIGPMAALRHE